VVLAANVLDVLGRFVLHLGIFECETSVSWRFELFFPVDSKVQIQFVKAKQALKIFLFDFLMHNLQIAFLYLKKKMRIQLTLFFPFGV
jgi:hypothetical protein